MLLEKDYLLVVMIGMFKVSLVFKMRVRKILQCSVLRSCLYADTDTMIKTTQKKTSK